MADAALARLASLIRQLQGALGGKTWRSGSDTATWAAGQAFSNTVTITHRLGKLPVAVTATCIVGGPAIGAYQAINWTTTTFEVKGQFVDGSLGAATQTFSWIASA